MKGSNINWERSFMFDSIAMQQKLYFKQKPFHGTMLHKVSWYTWKVVYELNSKFNKESFLVTKELWICEFW